MRLAGEAFDERLEEIAAFELDVVQRSGLPSSVKVGLKEDLQGKIWDAVRLSGLAEETIRNRILAAKQRRLFGLSTPGHGRGITIRREAEQRLPEFVFERTLDDPDHFYRAIAIRPNGRLVAAGLGAQRMIAWDADTNEELMREALVPQVLTSADAMAFGPDGRFLALGWEKQKIQIWDLDRQAKFDLAGPVGAAIRFAFSADGTRLASGSDDKTVHVWDLETKQSIARWGPFRGAVGAVAWDPNGERVAIAPADSPVEIWKMGGDRPLSLGAAVDDVASLAFSPDGRRLAVASGESIAVWDTERGRSLVTVKTHGETVRRVTFSRDGSLLLTGSDRGAVRVFVSESGAALPAVGDRSSKGVVDTLLPTPDGQRMLIGSWSGVRIWRDARFDGVDE